MTTPIHLAPLFYESKMRYISKKWNIQWCAQPKLGSMEPPFTTYPSTLIILELVHSQSQMEIKISIWNNMVLRHTFASYFHQKSKLNIYLSLTSRMRTNGSLTRHITIFWLSIQHQYSTWRGLYMIMNMLMTGYSYPLIDVSVHFMFWNKRQDHAGIFVTDLALGFRTCETNPHRNYMQAL